MAASAQQAPSRLAISLHGNTGSPPMLGIAIPLSSRTALRVSAGFYPETGSYVDGSASRLQWGNYQTNWYGGAIAGLYYLPSLWYLSPYTGLKAQYVYAHSTKSLGGTETADRIDAGACSAWSYAFSRGWASLASLASVTDQEEQRYRRSHRLQSKTV